MPVTMPIRRRPSLPARRRATLAWTAPALAVLAGCAAAPPLPAEPLDLVLQRELKRPPGEVAACLREQADRPSYPRGAGPIATTESAAGEGRRVEQWFGWHHRVLWVTRYDLRPAPGGGTQVAVRMDTALSLSQAYGRAARELVGHCAGG